MARKRRTESRKNPACGEYRVGDKVRITSTALPGAIGYAGKIVHVFGGHGRIDYPLLVHVLSLNRNLRVSADELMPMKGT